MEGSAAEAVFEIDDVLAKRINAHGHPEYLIKWKGYQNNHNSWEPQQSLVNCGHVLKKFELIKMTQTTSKHKNAGLAKARQLKTKALKAGFISKNSFAKKRKIVPKNKAREAQLIDSIIRRVTSPSTPEKKSKSPSKSVSTSSTKNNSPDSKKNNKSFTDKVSQQNDGKEISETKKTKDNGEKRLSDSKITEKDNKSTNEKIDPNKSIAKDVSPERKESKSSQKTLAQRRAIKDNHLRYKLNPTALRELTRLVADEKGNADALKQITELANNTKSGSVSLKALTELVTKEAEVRKRRKRKIEDSIISNAAKKAALNVKNNKKGPSPSRPKNKKQPSDKISAKNNLQKNKNKKKSPKAVSSTFQSNKSTLLKPRPKVQPKTEFVKPVPRNTSQGSVPTIHIPTPAEFGTFSTPGVIPQSATVVAQPQILMVGTDTFFTDMSTCTVPVTPLFPTSPTTESYRSLVMNLPTKLQANRLVRRRNSKEDDESDVIQRRLSVRQSESAFKYKEIVVKKFDSYTQIWLFTNTKLGNSLNPQVFQELISAFNNAKYDNSVLVMLSGTGSLFCSGVDLAYLVNAESRKKAVDKMVATLRDFVQTLISFPKPVVAAVNGPAIGLGATILPLCDVVYASDKASFYLPYSRLAQTPEGCSSFTFPSTLGMAMANEMLLSGRKLTAMEAYQSKLISQVFWPTTMMQEVVPRVQQMASQSARTLEASKLMVRSHIKAKLDYTNDSECNMLKDCWLSPDFYSAAKKYLDEEQNYL